MMDEEELKEMEEENGELAKLLVKTAEENRTRKILLMMEECKDLNEAKKKVKELL